MTDSKLNTQRIDKINAALRAALSPLVLDVTDESHLHVGHAGAQSGRGHFHVKIVAAQFDDLTLIKRHRLVYAALGDLMDTDIHALGIEAIALREHHA